MAQAQADIAFLWYLNGSEPLEWSIDIEYIDTASTFSLAYPLHWVQQQYQYLWLFEAAAHVMEVQSGFQGYKTFALGLLMAGIEFCMSILCGSWWKRILAHMMLY